MSVLYISHWRARFAILGYAGRKCLVRSSPKSSWQNWNPRTFPKWVRRRVYKSLYAVNDGSMRSCSKSYPTEAPVGLYRVCTVWDNAHKTIRGTVCTAREQTENLTISNLHQIIMNVKIRTGDRNRGVGCAFRQLSAEPSAIVFIV